MPKLDTIKASFSSGWNHIDALLDTGPGWNWLTPTRTVLNYSFSISEGTDSNRTGVSSALSAFNPTQKNAVREILAKINQITGITFSEVSNGTTADLHFANADITNANNAGYTRWTYNYSYDPTQTIVSYTAQAYVYIDNAESGDRYANPAAGNYAYELLMHEIGHAMGLKHPFEGGVTLPANEDNTDYTLMSYRQTELHSEYGPDDIAALKWLYGGDGLGGALGVGAQGKYLYATEKNDLISAFAGNDVIDGQSGLDTVSFSGNRANYKLSLGSAGLLVTGKEGSDTLLNVERLQFTDMHVNLQVQAAASSIATPDLMRLQELYVAFFNRVPDADGLQYWIADFKAGRSLNQIAASFYDAGVAASELTGYTKSMSNEAFVNLVYKNVLGRLDGADQEGLKYWTNALASGAENRGSLVQTILNSAHTFKGNAQYGWVADLLDNKMLVANAFAVKAGLNYNSDTDSIAMGMKIAALVTATDTNAALSLIGISADQYNLHA